MNPDEIEGWTAFLQDITSETPSPDVILYILLSHSAPTLQDLASKFEPHLPTLIEEWILNAEFSFGNWIEKQQHPVIDEYWANGATPEILITLEERIKTWHSKGHQHVKEIRSIENEGIELEYEWEKAEDLL